MTSFAIFEFVALLLALPLSYALAYLAKKHTYFTYKDELDRLFHVYWNGEEDDELNAWLKVKNLIPQHGPSSDKKISYIKKKIKEVNRSKVYSNTMVNEKGEVRENVYIIKENDE